MSTVLQRPTTTITPTPVVTPTPVRQRRTGRIVALVIGLIIVIAALAVGAWALFFRGGTTTALSDAEQIALQRQHAAVYYPVAEYDGTDLLPSGLVRSIGEGFAPIPAAPLPNPASDQVVLPPIHMQ